MYQVLFGSGDALAQQAVDRRGLQKHDFGRTGRMALYGGGRLEILSNVSSSYAEPRVDL